ncbi:NOV [Symbiodinium microadriaticum]|nr:NOV [Symbiodinium microadriaticum]
MPKPATWTEREFSKVLEAEQKRILDLARAQHDAFEQSLHLSFAKIWKFDTAKGGVRVTEMARQQEEYSVQADVPRAGPTLALTWDTAVEAPSAAKSDNASDAASAPEPISPPHSPGSGSTLQRSDSKLKKSKTKRHAEELLGLQTLVSHTKEYIDFVAGVLVLLNSCVMLAELEAEGLAYGAQLGLGRGPSLEEVQPIFQSLDTAFVFIFLIELLFRVAIERWDFLRDPANWFDAALVLLGLADLLIFVQLAGGSDAQNIILLRLVRVLKSVRAIRMLRTFRFLKGLRFLVKACQCFLPSLAWSMLLLFVFMCMGTLVLGNLLRDFILDETANMNDRLWVWDRYGTASRAMYTFYEITFAGNWPTNARPIMDKVNRLFVLFFAVYITIIVFAALRVITAVFLRDTLDAARNDDEALITERLRSKSKYLEKLEDVFEAIDSAHNGTISEKQLAEILAIPKAAAYFQTLDVDVLEGAALFRILDNGDGIITHEEFVDGILRCKGPARAMEQVAMRSELRQMDGPAIESLDALLACCERKPAEATAVCEPAISWEEFCAAEGLGGLSAARARTEEADKAELQQRLAAEQEARTRERRELENSLESLEAQLATAQRRAEEAEAAARAAATAVTVAQDKEDGRQKALPQNSTCQPARPANGQQWQDPSASSEAVFVASLRRQRLVGEDGSRLAEDLPEHVREGVQRLSDSLCAAVERLANDLYESECHFLYEIVQNAEDAHARARPQDSTEPCLSLRLGAPCPSFPHGYFISENNEAGFTERDVTALCDISASSKKKPLPGAASGSIGCKGIGFKSVFTVSDRAHVLSKGFTFVFDVQGRLGKLGYVTPTWLTSSELATLPAEVQRGHAQGKTVLFLPLRSAGLASAISQEMDELASQGRASLLFLRRLRRIELLGQAASTPRLLRSGDRSASEMTPEPMEVRSCSVVVEQHEPAQEVHQEHRYLVYRHLAPVASGYLQSMNAELVLAFPVLDEAETCSRCEPLFCSLPIRMVGFGFAFHCDCFDLVANRSDLHRGSLPNQVVRDALPQAFARACQASPEISRRALTLLGEPVADPFWRVSREGILEQLSDVSCVQTSTGDFRRPCEVLLRGLGALRRASDLFPAALISLSCKKSLCESSDSSEERLLRRLGAEDFGARHIAACLAYKGGQWPEGFVAHAWADSSGTGRRIIAELYNVLGAVVRPADGSDAGAEAVALMLELPSLPLFPLLKETAAEPGRPDVHTPARLCDGAVFLGLCGELSERWQKVLATANGALRLLPLEISSALDGLGSQLLSSLGVEPPGAGRLAEAALEVLMKAVPGARPSPPAIYASWAALAVLRDLWAKGDDKGTAAVTNALTSLRVCESKEAAEALLTTKALGSLLVAPALCGALRPPPSLRCMSVLGVYRQLPSDLIERIEAFLGADCGEEGSLLACPSSRSLQPWPLEEGQDEAQRWLEALKWEAFFVDCLGAQPRRPADPAQERAAPFLSLEMGIKIGGDDAHSLWGCLLDEKATSEPVFRYACRRLTDATDRAWFSELPARATRRVRELFLHSEYWPVAGAALNGVYLRLALPTGRGSELRRCLAGLGARAQLDVPGLTAALEALLRGRRDSTS